METGFISSRTLASMRESRSRFTFAPTAVQSISARSRRNWARTSSPDNRQSTEPITVIERIRIREEPVHERRELAIVAVESLVCVGLEVAFGLGICGEPVRAGPEVIEVEPAEVRFRLVGCGLNDRARILGQLAQGVLDVTLVEDRESGVELARDAAVVDDDAVLLLRGDAVQRAGVWTVHAGDGLQERVLAHGLVEVECLLNRCVETREQLVHDHEDLGLAIRILEGPRRPRPRSARSRT